jgi:Plasma-membrane choline transporter
VAAAAAVAATTREAMGRVDCSLTVRTDSSHSLSASDDDEEQPQSHPPHQSHPLARAKEALAARTSGTSPSSGSVGGGKQSPVAIMIAVTTSRHRQDNDCFGGSSSSPHPALADSASSVVAEAAASPSDRARQVVSPDMCSITSGVTNDGSADEEDAINNSDDDVTDDMNTAPAMNTITARPALNTTTPASSNAAGSSTTETKSSSLAAFYGIRRDSRDEQEGDDCNDDDSNCDANSLGYSDDSASLSDVYFHPQPGDDLSRPGIVGLLGRPGGSGIVSGSGMYGYYGSVGAAAAATAQHAAFYSQQTRIMHSAHHPMHSPPMAIQEDCPLLVAPPMCTTDDGSNRMTAASNNNIGATLANHHPYHHDPYDYDGSEALLMSSSSRNNKKSSSTTIIVSKKEQRRRRKQQQRQHALVTLRQREQAARERAVHQVKGQLQLSETWQDAFWAVLFLIQLVMVLALAVKYSWNFYKFNTINGSAAAWPSSSVDAGKFHGQQPGGGWLFAKDHVNSDDYYNNNSTTTTTTDNNITTTTTPSNTTATYNYDGGGDDDDFSVDFNIDFKNVVALTFCVGFYGWIISYLSFGFMLIVARSLIQIMLVSSILLALAWGVVGLLLDPYGIISLTGFAALLLTLGYTMYSWNRIPFAATNLYTALCALRSTADITILGLASLIMFGWCLLWTMAFVGIVNSNNNSADDCEDDSNHLKDCVASPGLIVIYLLLLLSFHWTNMVIKNVVSATVACAIGTWWFKPPSQQTGGRRFCTAATWRPLGRACTRSLGSICLGALVMQPAQFLNVICRLCNISTTTAVNQQQDHHADQQYPTNIPKQFSSSSLPLIGPIASNNCPSGSSSTLTTSNGAARIARASMEDHSHGLVHDRSFRIDSPTDSVNLSFRIANICQPVQFTLRSCNRFALPYIGMYNYSLLNAGEKAIQLFETRQWMEVVEDSLIHNVLLMASVVIGGGSGIFAVVVEETDGFEFTSFHQAIVSFLIGFVLGYASSNILLLGVVGSAVNTVLVCFATDPFVFDKNHVRLSREMRDVWSQQVWEPTNAKTMSN